MPRHALDEHDEGDPMRDAVAMFGRLTDFVMPMPDTDHSGRHRIPSPRAATDADDAPPTSERGTRRDDAARDAADAAAYGLADVRRRARRSRVHLARARTDHRSHNALNGDTHP